MKHRTALITAGSIAAVVFAGAIAVGANLGILTVADSRPAGVGQLSAATVVQTSGPKPAQEVAAVKKAANSQKYVIKKAGTVEVSFEKTGVRLVDVSAKRHWKWKLAQTGDKKLTVTFAHGSATYTFSVVVGRHGKLTARVDHPTTQVTPAASSASPTVWAASPAPSSASSAHVSSGAPDSGGGEPHDGGGADD